MSARSYSSPPIGWPLAGSFLFTALVTAFVCAPPGHSLNSWPQTFSRATLYLLSAGAVHLLAVWSICRLRSETEDTDWQVVWFIVYVAWISVVWLPLIALLTAEHSAWVAAVLPVTAIFVTLLYKWQAIHNALASQQYDDNEQPEFLALRESPPLWRALLPTAGTALACEAGAATIAANHAWIAGCLFGAALVYPLERWLDHAGRRGEAARNDAWRRTSIGNSLIVWVLLVLALLPFMATFAWLNGWLALGTHSAAPAVKAPSTTSKSTKGYTSIILTQPRKPHQITDPLAFTEGGAFTQPLVIPFDGDYWYFKAENQQPAAGTHTVQGTPTKNSVVSTDSDALLMEAHQSLDKPISLACCRTLRVDVINADNRPGRISLEILLRNTGLANKATTVSLGTVVLPSSAVSPMPLTRPPVDDKVTFVLPITARNKTFNEIAVRIKPERSRSLAGSKIAISNFALQR